MTELVNVNGHLNSWSQVESLLDKFRKKNHYRDYADKVTLLNLHCNELDLNSNDAFRVFQLLSNLSTMDLSFNKIDKLKHFACLTHLRILNLSNNQISDVSGLEGLKSLRVLRLAFNKIRSLSGFCVLHTPHSALYSLDLRGNLISEQQELSYLIGCTNLRHLQLMANTAHSQFKTGYSENPICVGISSAALLEAYRAEVFHILPSLASLDKQDQYGAQVSLEPELVNTTVDTYKKWLQDFGQARQESHSPSKNPLPAGAYEREKQQDQSELRMKIAQLEATLEKSINIFQSHSKDDKQLDSNLIEWLKTQLMTHVSPHHKKTRHGRHHSASSSISDATVDSETLHNRKEHDDTVAEPNLLENKVNNLEQQLLQISEYIEQISKSKQDDQSATLIAELESQAAKMASLETDLRQELVASRAELAQALQQRKSEQQLIKDMEHASKEKDLRISQLEAAAKLQTSELDSLKRQQSEKAEINSATKLKLDKALEVARQLKEHNATLNSQYQTELDAKAQFRKQVDELEADFRWQTAKIEELENQLRIANSKIEQERLKTAAETLRASQLQGELNGIQSLASSREKEYKKFVDELKSAHSREIANFTAAMAKNREYADKEKSCQHNFVESSTFLQRELTHQRELWSREEQELKRAISSERSRFDEMHASYRKVSDMLNESREQLSKVQLENKELRNSLSSLSGLVKELKGKLAASEEKAKQTAQYYDEKLDVAERELHKATEQVKSFGQLQLKLSVLEDKIAAREQELSAKIEQLQSDLQLSKKRAADFENLLAKEADGVSELEKKLSDAQDAVRVKSKMLEDQNQTIANLKQNLESKIKDQQGKEQRESQLAEQLEYETRAAKELQRETESLEDQLQSAQLENLALEKRLLETTQKLHQRQDDIARIEAEVAKVKLAFSQKDSQKVDELQKQLQTKVSIINELKAVVESSSTKVVELETERDELASASETTKHELEALKADKNQLELQIQSLVQDLEREKSLMKIRMSKIKSVFED